MTRMFTHLLRIPKYPVLEVCASTSVLPRTGTNMAINVCGVGRELCHFAGHDEIYDGSGNSRLRYTTAWVQSHAGMLCTSLP